MVLTFFFTLLLPTNTMVPRYAHIPRIHMYMAVRILFIMLKKKKDRTLNVPVIVR